jgi:hypothetical protein
MKATFRVVRTDTEEITDRWYREDYKPDNARTNFRSWLVRAEPELPDCDDDGNADPVEDLIYEAAMNGTPQEFSIENQARIGDAGGLASAGTAVEIVTDEKLAVGSIVTLELTVGWAP